jgi:hypothetical protein
MTTHDAPLAPGDPGPIALVEETRRGAEPSSDPRCKDYRPDPYIPPPLTCDEFVHYAPCELAQGRERRDTRPWWKRIWS